MTEKISALITLSFLSFRVMFEPNTDKASCFSSKVPFLNVFDIPITRLNAFFASSILLADDPPMSASVASMWAMSAFILAVEEACVERIGDDTTKFNEKMKVYLEFYNTKRVHCAFNNKQVPLEVLTASKYYVSKLPAECRNGWGYSLT